ncbi:hypothetical protein Drose_34955 [Dactylosporangium roseum]|uniref:Carrier domain-containing protein n=1 Tax=Dactylosporangium roseum TaxID=47989 RepID=A0ABY5Z3J3_9ACTN|nr:phosphopantetheine-binding protein [Dactylosporangium roseum]UWZ36199.1 hypothetical protein Drose_34955 [Dactylosporangium roseum]
MSQAQELTDPIRAEVTRVWRMVLEQDREFDTGDDFFAIGGHSLLALRVVKALSSRLGLDISLEAPFECPTFGEFVAAVRSAVKTGAAT